MHQQTLELRKMVLGMEHPDTLTSMRDLAKVLDSQGRHGEAEEMYRRTLERSVYSILKGRARILEEAWLRLSYYSSMFKALLFTGQGSEVKLEQKGFIY
jgi:Tetratricopeptide repeat